VQGSDRVEQLAAMTDQTYANVSEIVSGKLAQHESIDGIVAKRLFVLL
jgi:hypothetical protein